METYYFLFALALGYVIFASIQDIRKREVANWLNFSLIAFALAYRAIYSIVNQDYNVVVFGVIGFLIFYIIGNMFYYTKIFGGGDVKLLMAIGTILPYSSYLDIAIKSFEFLIALMLSGAIYSLIYSGVMIIKNFRSFRKEFTKQVKRRKMVLIICIVAAAGFVILGEIFMRESVIWKYEAAFVILIGLMYIVLKSLENSCMIKLVEPSKLTEGDWLEKEVKIGNKKIKVTVHGLSREDIKAIRKANKKVWIRYGVPFVPAFLIALTIMVFAWAVLDFHFESLLGLF
jgi:Flp pilus assembly protein protease CpaA